MEAGDVPGLLAFANTLIAEDTFILLSGKKITLKEEQKYVTDGLKLMKKGKKTRFVVTISGAIIASGEIRRGELRHWHSGDLGISVLAPYRGQGVGRALMEVLIAEARNMGLRMLWLNCFANNAAALHLYKKFGFIQCGILPEALSYKGGFVDELTMYTMLT